MKNVKKLFDLLSSPEKKKFFILLFLILVMAFFEMLGVVSIMPFMTLLSNPQLVETNTFFYRLYQKFSIFGVSNNLQFLFVLGIATFVLLMISLIVRGLTSYIQINFVTMREYSISSKVFKNYLQQPYIWFLSRHSADLGKNILSEVNLVVKGIIGPLMTIISQSTVVVMLLILLIIYDPALALSVGSILILGFFLIFYIVKNLLYRIGTKRVEANTIRFKVVSEVFGGIKEVKVAGLENLYVNFFSKPAKNYAINQSFAQVISQLPRYFIEGFAFGGMIILSLVLMDRGNGFTNIIPILVLYAFAGYRLIPALQQIYTAKTQLRFSQPAFDALHKDLVTLKSYEQLPTVNSLMRLNNSITIQNVSFSYPNSKEAALKNINISIKAFSKVGVVGATGSGKTTIVDIILGLLDPATGTLNVDGNFINHSNKRSWQKSIGFVPQNIYLSDSTVASNIAFGVDDKIIDLELIEKVAKIANIHKFIVDELAQGYNTNIGERGIRLSGGQKQRIGIARALYNNPQVLILDEATSALDDLTEKSVMKAIDNMGDKMTVIIIAHRLSTIKNCDNIFLLEKGRVISQGTYDQLLSSNNFFKN